MENTKNSSLAKLFPVMLCFFAMGFVDLVGIASNYVKADLNLTDSQANIFPVSGVLLVPHLLRTYGYADEPHRTQEDGASQPCHHVCLFASPGFRRRLRADAALVLIAGHRQCADANVAQPAAFQYRKRRAAGKFAHLRTVCKSHCFVSGSIHRHVGSYAGHSVSGHGLEGAVPGLYGHCGDCHSLAERYFHPRGKGRGTPFHLRGVPRPAGQAVYLSLLPGHHVPCGIDVGTNTTAPKILMERLGMTLADAGFATSLYFIFRTAGCFLGAFILQKMAPRTFFGISVLCMLAAMVGLFVFHEKAMIYICIALIGFGNSNIFPVIFSQALLAMPQKKNEVSGLMIMGLFGGTVFPIAMGLASDAVGQSGAVAVMTVGVVYLFFYMLRMKR